jgi:hypothetical protein
MWISITFLWTFCSFLFRHCLLLKNTSQIHNANKCWTFNYERVSVDVFVNVNVFIRERVCECVVYVLVCKSVCVSV